MLIVFISLLLFKVMIKVNIMILKNVENFVYPSLTSFFFVFEPLSALLKYLTECFCMAYSSPYFLPTTADG